MLLRMNMEEMAGRLCVLERVVRVAIRVDKTSPMVN